jgi:hypothetical protein
MNLSRVPTPALAEELISRPDGRAEIGRIMRPASPRAKVPTPCRCGALCASAREARDHCRKPRERRG